YILGINLEANSRKLETAEADALVAGIGRRHVTALELGNEPELYSKLGWYRLGASYVPGRPANYDFDGFTREFSGFRSAVSTVPVAGPSTGSYWWLQHLSQFLAAEPSLGMVTIHSYWLNRCLSSTTLPGYPTVPNLLNPHPPSRLAGQLGHFASLAHARGVPIRIDEMNSVTCGGEHGVSDVFASSLWAVNALFEAMSDGVDGVNVHTFPGTANQLFGFSLVGGHWVATVRPEYYGLLMFARAAPPGSQELTVIQQHTGQTRAWATMGRDGRTRVVLINDSLTQPASVLLRAFTPGQPAQLERLLAPSATATTGITLDGQSFGAQTQTGTLSGPTATETLPAPTGPGPVVAYTVPVPSASAVMVTIPPRPQS
ncbi:MAG TPA: glycosyl hydrolase family 79 C-terminal domain-containing protein, partial [Solirubrobacteraceae bacterium]|nr:glycosyl hydrolase family 79 C-terminal domain-containing protein [Solirubrobacteraceae bacterium]